MGSPTFTTLDILDLPPPLAISDRHYAPDVLTVFKVEDILFRFDRTLLDKETGTIPQGEGSREHPIELEHRIKAADFEILLDFLKLRTRHDKKPLTVVDWASIIAVCSILGMQHVRTLAFEALSDPQKALLDHQKRLLEQNSHLSSAGAGFKRDTYFLIREKGTDNYLGTYGCWKTEGVQLQLWPRKIESAEQRESQVFFIDRSGTLCHAVSGLTVDIIDDVPVLRRNHLAAEISNPWSHPPAEFSFVNSQIRVKFLADPSPRLSCSKDLYPEGSWCKKSFVLASHPEKDFHMHSISDFSAWIPSTVARSFKHETEANHDKTWRVLVEERTNDVGGARTSWEIIAASKS